MTLWQAWWLWFPLVNFPHLSSNIPESPAYGVFVSQLIRYARVCWKYDVLFRGSILVSKLLKQGYSSTFRKFYCQTDLVHFCVTYVEPFVHQLWHMTGFQLLWVNRDGCHMWGRKCSLFPEHLISLPVGNSWFHSFIILQGRIQGGGGGPPLSESLGTCIDFYSGFIKNPGIHFHSGFREKKHKGGGCNSKSYKGGGGGVQF